MNRLQIPPGYMITVTGRVRKIGSGGWNKGIPHTPEHCEKIRIGNLGKISYGGRFRPYTKTESKKLGKAISEAKIKAKTPAE